MKTGDGAQEYRERLEVVINHLTRLSSLANLHLTSIAKAIERLSNDIRKIIFYPCSPSDFGKESPNGLMLTQELEVKFIGVNKTKTIFEHFVYYPKHNDNDSKSIEKTRFSVAHELGHILMHEIKDPDNDDRSYYPLDAPDIKVYRVMHTIEEEQESDIFAAILCDQRKQPERPDTFHEPCIRTLNRLAGLDIIGPRLADIMPKASSCFLTPK